ncbi:MAG: imidazolonepropionase [Candidatus Sericytochromatia bacterium]|nr:imidazolonepropionase [Candidatus Sericytochromatia bacterium]
MKTDLIIINANELLPMNSNGKPVSGRSLNELKIIENGAIAVKDGKIIAVDTTDNILKDFELNDSEQVIDAKGKTVIPGFVDCHTHLVFAGTRENEFVQRIEKQRNTKNVMMGSGIQYTVSHTRKAEKEQLIQLAKKRLKRMLSQGITYIEAKSGYGLDLENELKILEVHHALKSLQDIEIESTFLGAHSIPQGYNSKEYTEIVINEMIPYVAKTGLARFCDVFCEEGFFSKEQSEKILNKAKESGMLLKLHADQLTNTYGAELAAKVGAVSADHLDYAYEDGLRAMAQKGVVGVLLPTISFVLDLNYPDARNMMEMGLPIAISTDFNPGAGHSESMSFVITTACLKLKMLPIEAIASATINAAYACGIGHKVGSLEVGKQADILIMDAPNHKYIPYHYGINLVESVVKKGKVVHQNHL